MRTTSDVYAELEYHIRHHQCNKFDKATNQEFTELLNCSFLVDKDYIIETDDIKYDDQWYIDNYDPLITQEQIDYCLENIKQDIDTRKAIIYLGGKDGNGICTESIHLNIIKYKGENKLIWSVNMRSSDVSVFPTDIRWHRKWIAYFLDKLNIQCVDVYWNAISFHVYQKDYKYFKNELKF